MIGQTPTAVAGQILVTPTEQWLGTAILLIVVVAASLAIRRIGRWLRDRYDPRGSLLEATQAALIVALSAGAIAAVLWIWDANTAAETLQEAFRPNSTTVVRGLVSVFLLLGAWGATVLVRRLITLVFEDQDAFSRHQYEVGYHAMQVVLYLLAILASIAVWGIDLSNILLGAGFLSVVVGLAARQTLASILAGFVLLLERPFDIGDWVAIEDHEGVITDVSLFNTRMRTFNGEYVVFSNDTVAETSLVNRSRRGRLRVDVKVGVDYQEDIERAREIATEAMDELDIDEIRSHPNPKVVPVGFDDSAVLLELRFWVDDPTTDRRWRAQSKVVTAVKRAFEEADITIPFPQRTLSERSSGVLHSRERAGEDS